MVEPRGGREATYGNLVINLAGSKEEEAKGRDIHAVGARGMWRSISGSQDAETETVDDRVGRLSRAVDGDAGTGTGDACVGK